MSAPKFCLGQLVATPNALEHIPTPEILVALRRHVSGDWGDLDLHDRQENEFSLTRRLRLLSVYRSTHGLKFWIITDSGHLRTTVLLPEDY